MAQQPEPLVQKITVKDIGSVVIRRYNATLEKSRGVLNRLGNQHKKYDRSLERSIRRKKQAQAAARKLQVTLASLAGAAGAGLVARQFIAANAAVENFQVRMNAAAGDQGKANKIFQDTADFASTVAFEYRDLMEAATQLTATVGGTPEEIQKHLRVVSDLAAFSGLTIQQTTQNYIRALSAGAASADLFRERGVNAMLGFEAGVSYSAEETRDKIFAAFDDIDSRFRDTSKNMANTWTGTMSMLNDAVFNFYLALGNTDDAKASINAVTSIVRSMTEGLDDGTNSAKTLYDNLVPSFKSIVSVSTQAAEAIMGIAFALKQVQTLMSGIGGFSDQMVAQHSIFDLRSDLQQNAAELDRLAKQIAKRDDSDLLRQRNVLIRQRVEIRRQLEEARATLNQEMTENPAIDRMEQNYREFVESISSIQKSSADLVLNHAEDRARLARARAEQQSAEYSPEVSAPSRAGISIRSLMIQEAADAVSRFGQVAVPIYEKMAESVRQMEDRTRKASENIDKLTESIKSNNQSLRSSLFGRGVQGISAEGPFSEGAAAAGRMASGIMDRAAINRKNEQLLADLQKEFAVMQAHKDRLAALEGQHSDKVLAINKELAEKQEAIQKATTESQVQRQASMAALIADTFATAGSALRNFREATNNESKELLALQKLIAISQATASTYLAATQALASRAILGPGPAIAAASIITAAGLANVAAIAATPTYHQGGLVGGRMGGPGLSPTEQSAILQSGEYVISRQGMVALLDSINSGKAVGGGGGPTRAYIVDSDIAEFMASERGESLIRRYSA